MNKKFTDNMNADDEKIAKLLSETAEKTKANAHFSTELEGKLREAHTPRATWSIPFFSQISPALRWAMLMILLALVLSWSIRSLIPAPQPAVNDTPIPTDTATLQPDVTPVGTQTSAPSVDVTGDHDWRGTKLSLAQPLPSSPAEANVYKVQAEQPATAETARALADLFGLRGQVFEGQLEPNATAAFSVVDGNQTLNVRSDRYFEYIADSTKLGFESPFALSNPNADVIIADFMTSHGFDFPYTVEPSGLYQGYYVQAITPDGLPIHHEFFAQNGLLFKLDGDQVIFVSGNLLKYDLLGTYGIKSAQEAFQQVLASKDYSGMIEGVHSSLPAPQIWRRDYPTEQTVTIYGFMRAVQSVNSPDLRVSIDDFAAKGNLAGAEKLGKLMLVKATGQFVLENGSKVFKVESWEAFKRDDHGYSGKEALMGTLQAQGSDVVFVSDRGTLLMPDVPADIPLPLENAYVVGVTIDNTLEWESIQQAPNGGGGGGGGGSNGVGFYKLNLSGPPFAFPTTAPQTQTNGGNTEYVVQEGDTVLGIAEAHGTTPQKIFEANHWTDNGVLMPGQTIIIPGAQSLNPFVGRRFENQRGIFTVTIFQGPEGTERKVYNFITSKDGENFYLLLEGNNLQELEKYHNRPVEISGVITDVDANNVMTFKVESYNVPFPNLGFQILRGTQTLADVQGEQILLFIAENGTTYACLTPIGDPMGDRSLTGAPGDQILVEGLAIPDETYGGYPGLRFFGSSVAVNPNDGQATQLGVTADQPNIIDETQAPERFAAPALTIEKVELVYYEPYTRYATFDESGDAGYIQPAWRFYGHYESGDEFEVLIQALKQEFLLPELAPYTPPG